MRVSALVNVGMTPEEVAEIVGCSPSAVVSYKNGVAVIAEAAPLSLAEVEADEALEEE